MKNLSLIILLFCSVHLSAQTIFVEAQEWRQVLEQAKQKPIFFDGVTKWCKPCKVMEKKVFADKDVAKYMVEHFINVKVDLESKLGAEVNQNYKISVYPTLMILNSKGQVEARHIGGLTTTEEFMDWITIYADKKNHKSVLEEQHNTGNNDPSFLQYYAKMMAKSLFPNAVALDKLYHLNPGKYYQFFIKEINTTRSEVLASLKNELPEDVLNEIVIRCQERIFYTDGINPTTLALSVKGKPEESYQALLDYEN